MLKLIQGHVAGAIKETEGTWTLQIFVDPEHRDYLAGQFVSIDPHQFPELAQFVAYLEHKKGRKEPIRAYSIASAPWEPYVCITTKVDVFEPGECEYPPLLSPLLASDILRGRPIEIEGYAGAYVLHNDHGTHTDEVLHLVAGSGVVPNFGLIKDQLKQNKNLNVVHTFVDINKTYEDIIYREELEQLAREYPTRLKLMHFLTREPSPEKYGPHFYSGRPSTEAIVKLVRDTEKVLVFACGAAITKWQRKKAKETGIEPKPRFLEWVAEVVKTLGVDKKRYKREIYG